MSAQLTLGVIGHVDHGKTALVRALTGIETDRLKEERERGLSIVLGFSYLETPAGTIDLIDVPGHEDFIRTMISGATGIDGILLIVAANEGVMPQTREHFDIARLLGVERGVIAVTKTDLITDRLQEKISADIRAFLHDSFLAQAPLVFTSAVRNTGFDALRLALEQLACEPVRRPRGSRFYLPIDRVFSMPGFGTVVTGTLRGGTMSAGDAVEIQPGGARAAVRQLQIHNRDVDAAYPGQRVAVNLRGVKRHELRRGLNVCAPGTLAAAPYVAGELELLGGRGKALRNAASVRLLFGATEAIARARLLDRDALAPGETAPVQFRCRSAVAVAPGERFIVRSYSPMRTIGGGRILAAGSERYRRYDDALIERLATAARGSPRARIAAALTAAGLAGAERGALEASCELAPVELEAQLADLSAVPVKAQHVVDAAAFEALRTEILQQLEQFHREHVTQRGLALATLRAGLPPVLHDRVFEHALETLETESRIERIGTLVRLPGFDPRAGLDAEDRKRAQRIEAAFREGGLAPPAVADVVGRDARSRELLRVLLDSGVLVQLRGTDRERIMVFHQAALDDALLTLERGFPPPSRFTLSQARQLLASTRKYVVPLMEHMDAVGLTIRSGDHRQLRRR